MALRHVRKENVAKSGTRNTQEHEQEKGEPRAPDRVPAPSAKYSHDWTICGTNRS